MLGKLIPLVLAVIGLGAGIGAGIALKPDAAVEAAEGAEGAEKQGDSGLPTQARDIPMEPPGSADHPTSEFFEMSNQFVFPLVKNGEVYSLVVLALTLEVAAEQSDAVMVREPKLRDGFLRVLLDHANSGGFEGAFTSNRSMDNLRNALFEKGRQSLGPALYDVLITDINRQDT